MSGWLRKTTKQTKVIKSAQFPLRFFSLNFKTGKLEIFSKPGNLPKH